MSSSDGGSGYAGVMAGGAEPEYFVDRAEARVSDAQVNMAEDARSALRELIHAGVQQATDPGRPLAPSDLEPSLDRVIDDFVAAIEQQDVTEVDPHTLETIWAAICFYPWCRR